MDNVFELGSIMIHPAKKTTSVLRKNYPIAKLKHPAQQSSMAWGKKMVKVEILGQFMYHSFSLCSLCA
jgi:hypothetical protein